MTEKKVFRVDYPSGNMAIYLGDYFGTMEKKKIDKFLRIVKPFCSEEKKQELVQALLEEVIRLNDGILILRSLEEKRVETLNEFFDKRRVQTTPAERMLAKRRDKVKEYAEMLEKERWGL